MYAFKPAFIQAFFALLKTLELSILYHLVAFKIFLCLFLVIRLLLTLTIFVKFLNFKLKYINEVIVL